VGARRAADLGPGQPGERERTEHQPEVAQRDVAVAADEQQVDDDAAEPAGDQQAAVSRSNRDHETGDDLDDADDVHRVVGVAGQDAVELAREVARPVIGEHLGELVQAEQDRRDGEGDPQKQERLPCGSR